MTLQISMLSFYLVILGSILFFSSKASIVTGSVAELDAVPNAVNRAFPMFDRYLNGSDLVMRPAEKNVVLPLGILEFRVKD